MKLRSKLILITSLSIPAFAHAEGSRYLHNGLAPTLPAEHIQSLHNADPSTDAGESQAVLASVPSAQMGVCASDSGQFNAELQKEFTQEIESLLAENAPAQPQKTASNHGGK